MQPNGRGSSLTCNAAAVRTASVSFPLTPALSLGERGNRSHCVGGSNRAACADGLAAILPLPKGEGRGEGEQDAA